MKYSISCFRVSPKTWEVVFYERSWPFTLLSKSSGEVFLSCGKSYGCILVKNDSKEPSIFDLTSLMFNPFYAKPKHLTFSRGKKNSQVHQMFYEYSDADWGVQLHAITFTVKKIVFLGKPRNKS
uniref:Uncharacterized protein n=1 Tax=Solanum lycopersicum TaxID=4081 RepID=A0A3Q7FJG4_SOLLC